MLAIVVLLCHQNANGSKEEEVVQKPAVLHDVQKHPKMTKLQHFETIEAQLGKLHDSDEILAHEIKRTRELLEETAKGATLVEVIKNSKMVEALKKAGYSSGSTETAADANIDVEKSESDVETIAVNAKKDVKRGDPNPKRVHGRRAHRLLKVVKNAEDERKEAEKNALEQTAIAISDYSKVPPLQLVKEGKQVIESLVKEKAESTKWFGKLAEAAKSVDATLNQKAAPNTAQKRNSFVEFGKFMTPQQKLKRWRKEFNNWDPEAETKPTLGEAVGTLFAKIPPVKLYQELARQNREFNKWDPEAEPEPTFEETVGKLFAKIPPVKLYQDLARQNREFNKWDPEAEPEPTLGDSIGKLVAKIPPVKLYQDLARQNREFNKWDPEAEPEPTLGDSIGKLVAKIPPVKVYQDLARQNQEFDANQAEWEAQDEEEA